RRPFRQHSRPVFENSRRHRLRHHRHRLCLPRQNHRGPEAHPPHHKIPRPLLTRTFVCALTVPPLHHCHSERMRPASQRGICILPFLVAQNRAVRESPACDFAPSPLRVTTLVLCALGFLS